MRRAPALATLAVLSAAFLSACSQGGPEKKAAAPAAVTPTTLGGVDLNQPISALGTEPFWNLKITPDAMVFTGVDRDEQRAGNPQPVVQGTTAVYTAATGSGTAVVVTLIATECSDGMSDRTYPLTARVEMGEETLSGCAASQAWLDAQVPA